MSITSLDGNRFAEMILSGANHLSANAEIVDALNVFPVPDGDTGTNMKLSITSGSKEAQANKQSHIGKVGAAFAKGLLMGARGNSGVILSQLFRGFSKDIEHRSVITGEEFAHALKAGVETAYKAVMKPVEGTILTVAKDAASEAVKTAGKTDDLIEIMQKTLEEAKRSLERTQDLLPVLKEVGVVDSGGQGLVFVYEGFLSALTGKEIPEVGPAVPSMEDLVSAQHHQSVHGFMDTEEIEFGYCTEFMVRLEDGKRSFVEDEFRSDLSQYGDSLLVISDDDVAKVHIHSERPGDVLSYGQQYGPLIHMKIENMREQHSALTKEKPAVQAPVKEKQEYAIISVSMGKGVGELLKSIGASAIIEGGQTMNPSTEDIVEAIKAANAKNVIILPNNKNIIMAAEQAVEIAEENVVVVPSKTLPQGMAAILAFNPTASLEGNREGMTDAMKEVKTGQVTYAVRDTVIDGVEITKDDYMGIADGKIVASGPNLLDTAKNLLNEMIDEESEVLTILYGEDADKSILDQLTDFASQNFEDVEVEVHDGGQPVYTYIFSVE
ncbi:MAG TPA: DAK2 domain-containing protein [Bacillus bacterium]|uniref:Phosphatase n=1 Tax=Siminovitchia fordii TaxID=254759 RepID=A0ABQ4K232_9BACI|nr:DAK2 domain-containing protein [Siminovitchia fordii]GIN18981.1 phosphatase [Siminovitchia fordii]HBZ10404.1 DAK2 domain-containing protein [Bacillus sp. (in: firmicutes)]